MDNKRIIGKILIDKQLAIQSKGFAMYLPLGKPEILAEALDQWQVDEVLLIDRSASINKTTIDEKIVERVVEVCRSPLTVGGGVCSVEQAELLISNGADRICINSAFHENPGLLTQLSDMFGRQAVVAALDFTIKGKMPLIFDHKKKVAKQYQLIDACKLAEDKGAGELFIHSVDRDGLGTGYEVDVYNQVVQSVSIPVIASGGYGKPSHVQEAINSGVNAIAIGNQLNYVEHSVALIKGFLQGNDIRKTNFDYRPGQIDSCGRLIKQNDDYLDSLKFVKREGRWV